MFQPMFDTNAIFDLTMKSFIPVTRAAELSARAFEKLARFQVESAIDLVNHANARIQATTQAHGPLELAARHTELTANYVELRTAQWQEFLKFTSDLQGDVTKWAEDAKAHVTDPLRQAA
jgi:Phasin protein